MPTASPSFSPSYAPRCSGTASRKVSPSLRGYTKAWYKLARSTRSASPLCVMCQGVGRVTAAQEVDHIVPLSQGGTNDDSNLQPLCKQCHARKTAQQQQGTREGGRQDGAPTRDTLASPSKKNPRI